LPSIQLLSVRRQHSSAIKIFCSMGYVTNRNQRHPLRVFLSGFLHIHTLLLTTFFKIKNAERIKKRDLNKKRKKHLLHLYLQRLCLLHTINWYAILKLGSSPVVGITVIYVVTLEAFLFVGKLLLTICKSAMRPPKLANISRRSSSFSGQGYTVALYLSIKTSNFCHYLTKNSSHSSAQNTYIYTPYLWTEILSDSIKQSR